MLNRYSNVDIEKATSLLQSAGVHAVEVFRRKLAANARESMVTLDLLAEGEAALAFARAGFRVRMDERPDLVLQHSGQELGAEVKHFRMKDQDRIDEEQLANGGEFLVEYGNTVPLEGKTAWDQIVGVAVAKARKLACGRPNLLVIVSDSPGCIDDLAVMTAASILNDVSTRRAHPELSIWNGLMLISREYSARDMKSAHFFELTPAAVDLGPAVRTAVERVQP